MFDASMKMIFEKKYWKWKLILNHYKIIGLVCSFDFDKNSKIQFLASI